MQYTCPNSNAYFKKLTSKFILLEKVIQFQNIIQLEVTRRPSKKIKSPYVADAINKDGDEFLVHTPGLGLADQCLPGSKIFATPSKSKDSKTDYIAQFVSINEEGYGQTLIGANPRTAELIGKEILRNNIWNPYPKYEVCNRKPPHIDYLGDIYLKFQNKYIIIEMKNVICASYNPNIKEVDRRYVFYDNTIPFRRSGIYPNGERSQKYRGESVVSERSVRQIDSMVRDKEKYQFAIMFLVNRGDCTTFKPNWQRDPIYSKKLVKAVKNGIGVYALGINWTNKACNFNGELEIDLKPW